MGETCPACGYSRAAGCAFGCPIKKSPDDPRNYRHWADLQKEKWRQAKETHAKRCPLFQQEMDALGSRIDRRREHFAVDITGTVTHDR